MTPSLRAGAPADHERKTLRRGYYHNRFIFVRPAISTEHIDADPPSYRSYYPLQQGLRHALIDLVLDLNFERRFADFGADLTHVIGAFRRRFPRPFRLEALVTAVIGVALAAGALGAFMYYGIFERAGDQLKFMPWIGMPEYTTAVLAIAILGPLLTVVPTLLLTRKYLKV